MGDETDEITVPPAIELAWGLREPGVRGPKRGLTLERIVAAGIKIAMTDGLGGVSMSRVANELGVATMALYRYVDAKDELLVLMTDTALGPPPASVTDAGDWRTGLTRWAEGVRAAYHRHLWALRVPISDPPLGPNNVAWLEAALRCLTGTPLAEEQKLSIVLLLSGFVRNEATLMADIAAGAGAAGDGVMPGYGAVLTRVADRERFPAVHAAIASGALDDDDGPDVEFTFGLERILDGIDVLIAKRASARRKRRRG